MTSSADQRISVSIVIGGKARARFLEEHPLCKTCQEQGRLTVAFAVDHRVPHRGNVELFWDESNWDPMCESHHNRKSRSERLT